MATTKYGNNDYGDKKVQNAFNDLSSCKKRNKKREKILIQFKKEIVPKKSK